MVLDKGVESSREAAIRLLPLYFIVDVMKEAFEIENTALKDNTTNNAPLDRTLTLRNS